MSDELWRRLKEQAWARRDELTAHEGCDECWLNVARSAFYSRVMRDPAWRALGHDEIMRRIKGLT